MPRLLPLLALAATTLLPAQAAFAQEVAPIADNSFLIEEAYNQEAGVVQHISTFMTQPGAWNFGFTQEWPVFSQEHQLSYTIPLSGGSPGIGLGDLMLNYRYQALGVGGGDVAFAPRLSLVAPTSAGSQGLAYEANLPLSMRVGPALVSHTNLGASLASDGSIGYFAGQSLIWLMTSRVNPLVEVLWRRNGSGDELTLNPGLRWAYDRGDTQIVPGIAAPVTFANGATTYGAFLYLSIEHPFGQ